MTQSIGTAIVAQLDAIYQTSIENLREAMRAYARDGSIPPPEARADRLRLTVRDNGIGIPRKTLARIGVAFEQANNDPMRAREGTGLGLALVKSLVAQHGGTVTIESSEGFGTTVSVELPLVCGQRIAA